MGNDFIGKKIRVLRKCADMSINDVGKAVGKSGATVGAWETGRTPPSAEMLIEICRLFKVDISYFFPPDITGQFTLTKREARLINAYRHLDEEKKNALEAVLWSFAGDGQDIAVQSLELGKEAG